ncbi:hypothetical protein [Pseudomonas aeruginosa]|uniref:hypothetical protein n=1 Tax=Pseudomonas aeruginosa TaxID=287 RepID=UPI00163B7CCD|nr:hypothetical protein [Pseudomonas aeruginosa]
MSSLPVPVSLDSTLRHLGSADPRRPFLIDAREPERPLEYTWGDADRQVDALAEQAWTRWPANIRSRARWPGCA